MIRNRLWAQLLTLLMVITLFLTPALATEELEELSKEELMQLLAETVPEGQENPSEYLVLPEDSEFQTPQKDVFQLLLIGTDTYSVKAKGRSDVMMLAQLDQENKTIKLVSFLRDLYVKIPGKGSTRINAAYAYGGADLLLKTMKTNFGIEPDAYIVVNFSRMADLVDQIGGVEVEVSKSERTQLNNILKSYNLKMGIKQNDGLLQSSGLQVLTGRQALSFSRIRKIDSDFERTNRQRTVVEAAFHKMMTFSWDKIGELVIDNMDNVITNLSVEDAIKLIPMALNVQDATFATMQIPAKNAYSSQTISGMAVLVPNLSKNVQQLNDFLYKTQE